MIYVQTYNKFEKVNNIEKRIIQVELIEESNLFEGITYKVIIRHNNKNKYKYFEQDRNSAIKKFNELITKYN